MISALDVLKELSTLIPKETEIELTRFTVDDMGTDVRLTIEGTAKTKDDVFQIEDFIKRSPEFFDVQRGGLTLLGQRHKFDFVAKLREKQQ